MNTIRGARSIGAEGGARVLAVSGLTFLMTLGLTSLPTDAEAQGLRRARQCASEEIRTVRRIAARTANHALRRYELKGLVEPADLERSRREMYDFLKWKMGGTTAVCAQFVTAGQSHFNKTYRDEAAAMMLRLVNFAGQQPELDVPDWMISYLRLSMETLTGTSVRRFLSEELGYGQPLPLDLMVEKVMDVFENQAKRGLKAFIPKSYDVPDRVVRNAIQVRQDERRLAAREDGVQGAETMRDRVREALDRTVKGRPEGREARPGRPPLQRRGAERPQERPAPPDRSDRAGGDRNERRGGEASVRRSDASGEAAPCPTRLADPTAPLPLGVVVERTRNDVRVRAADGYRLVRAGPNRTLVMRGDPGSQIRRAARAGVRGLRGVTGTIRCHCSHGDDNCAVEKSGRDVSCRGQCLAEQEPAAACELDVRIYPD